MASYYAKIPPEISAKHVFEAVSAEVAAVMNGITVTADGDDRLIPLIHITHQVT